MRIAVVVSHPIQHFCPQYVSFAKDRRISLCVFFASAMGSIKYLDPNFKTEVSWGNLRLNEFSHIFLNGYKAIPSDRNIDAPTLGSELDKFDPDLIIIYGYFQKLQRRAYQWAVRKLVPIGYISDSELRHRRNPFKEILKFLFIKSFFSKISFFLSVGDANEAFYQLYGITPDRFVRMHFPIDISLYEKSFMEKDSLRTGIRRKFEIDDHEIVLSVVGKLVPWKSQNHIIDAMGLLEDEGIYLHLFILGSGEMMEMLKARALKLKRSKVYFPGFVNIDELPAYYAASDTYVHPASAEPHSIAVSEAIFMGCPVIISDRCGSYGETDDVQEGRNGYVFSFGDIRDLADKIKLLAADRDLREKFSEESHALASTFQRRSHFSVLNDLLARIGSKNEGQA